jgi:penicillin-binding protein 1A
VGGKDFNTSQFNRASQALRSPGSTFKLFAYTAAVSAGLKPEDTFSNQKRCYPAENFCIDGKGGTSTMVNGLAMSMNAFAVDVAEKTGYERVIQIARKLGITEEVGAYPAMVLGANEQTVLDMTAAYAAIANRGMFVKPTPFEEIRGPNGEVLWSRRVDGDRGSRAVDSDVADAVNWMLQRVVTSGTGRAASLDDRQVAGKTGTSEGARDLWFIGSVPQLTTSVWFGYDSNMKTGSSSGQAAWAWNQFMTKIKGEIPLSYFPKKPVLNRKFTPPGKKDKTKGNQEAPYRGYEYEPVPRFDDSPYAPPDYPTEPYAAPGPATDYAPPAAPAPEPAYEAPAPPAYEAPLAPPPAAEGPRNWLVPQVQDR